MTKNYQELLLGTSRDSTIEYIQKKLPDSKIPYKLVEINKGRYIAIVPNANMYESFRPDAIFDISSGEKGGRIEFEDGKAVNLNRDSFTFGSPLLNFYPYKIINCYSYSGILLDLGSKIRLGRNNIIISGKYAYDKTRKSPGGTI